MEETNDEGMGSGVCSGCDRVIAHACERSVNATSFNDSFIIINYPNGPNTKDGQSRKRKRKRGKGVYKKRKKKEKSKKKN